MKNIEYTTVEQQIEKLLSQNLTINDIEFAKHNLALYGYSNLIKSYREPYIIRANDQISYREGVTFEQIRSLYLLDKNLRNSVMAAMQDLEEHIKETAASTVSESFGTAESNYLKYKNYRNVKKRKKRFQLPAILDTLKNTLNTDKNPIHHYSEKYDNVPPWILVKSIYFSTIVNFIDLFKKDELTKMVDKLYDKSNLKLSDDVLPTLMMDTLYICLDYRNTAAHGGRIYNHKSKYKLKTDIIFDTNRHVPASGFSQLLFLLSLFEYKAPFKQLHSALEKEITRHCNSFPQDVTYLGQILNINIVPTYVVYTSKNSRKYHSNPHCSGIKNVKKMELNKAKQLGFVPCKRCN